MIGNTPTYKIPLLIFILTFLLYGNSIKNGYAFDDNYVAVTTPDHPNNPKIVKGLKGIPEIFKTHYIESKEQSFEYRPLVLTSFAIEYQFFGSNPHISHFINVLFYAITCVLLFLILSKLLKKYNIIPPLLITLLFLVHPIHTEVVTSIKCRDELLAFLFGLFSLHFILKSLESKKNLDRFIAVLFFFMAYLCKATSALFLLLIPFTLYFFTSANLKKILFVFFLLALAMLCQKVMKMVLLHDASKFREYAFFENPLFFEHGFLNRIPLALYSTGYYLKLLIFPYPLCCYYGYDTIPVTGWTSPVVIASGIFYLAILIYAVRKIPEKNILSFGIFVYLMGISPFANVITPVVGIVGERFIYFASFGFCLVAAYLLLIFFKIDIKTHIKPRVQSLKFSFIACVGILLVIYAALTISRNTQWKDEITLFRNDARHFDNSCNLHYLIGNKLYTDIFNMPNGAKKDSMVREATFHFKRAVQLMTEGVKKYPADHTTLNNIGTIYVNVLNDAVSAQPFFKRSIDIEPGNDVAQYNFAFCYEKRNLPDSAILCYEKLALANTTYSPVYFQLHELYINKKQYPEAIACDKKAIGQNPSEARLYINLGNAYMLNRDTLDGIQQFERAVELEPSNTGLRTQIVAFLKSAGYPEKANKLEKN